MAIYTCVLLDVDNTILDFDAAERQALTDMLAEYFSEAARPHTMVLIEEVKDGGYARADEVFILPDEYRARES